MAKGEQFSLISATDPPPPSTALHIFTDASKLLWRSCRPMLSILLVLLLPQSLLFFGNYLIITPLSADMSTKSITMGTIDPRSPQYSQLLAAVMKDVRELTLAEIAVMVISFLLSSFLLMAAVHTVAMARKGEQVTLKDLLCRVSRTWKGPVVTKLYVAAMGFVCMFLLLILFGVLSLISGGSMAVLLALGAALAVVAILPFLYLQMVWYQAMVISVVEVDCYGLAALVRASEIIRGRRGLGVRMNLLLLVISTVIISVPNFLVNSQLPPGGMAQLVSGLVVAYAGLMMTAFTLAAYVVFYHECKKSHGEEVAMKGSFAYTRVSTAPALDGDLP